MKLQLLLFGITKDILGDERFYVHLEAAATVGDLRAVLLESYPQMKMLRSLLIAVNNEYAEDDVVLSAKDEVALIPPVSGG